MHFGIGLFPFHNHQIDKNNVFRNLFWESYFDIFLRNTSTLDCITKIFILYINDGLKNFFIFIAY